MLAKHILREVLSGFLRLFEHQVHVYKDFVGIFLLGASLNLIPEIGACHVHFRNEAALLKIAAS
jgi:hypothetical protein